MTGYCDGERDRVTGYCDGERDQVTGYCDGEHCITCSDEAVAMTVLTIDADRALALCEGSDGQRAAVEIGIVDAAEGATLLVHAGTAIGVASERDPAGVPDSGVAS